MMPFKGDKEKGSICFVQSYIGDYHAARLLTVQEDLERLGQDFHAIQVREKSLFYAHRQTRRNELLQRLHHTTLCSGAEGFSAPSLWRQLAQQKPSHIFVLGYNNPLSLASIAFAKLHRSKIFFMSDSKADDQERQLWREVIKSLILRAFDGALVAGKKHKIYFESLGCRGPCEIGYDVIDNQFFQKQGERLLRRVRLAETMGILPQRYVLCVSRLVDRKRVDRVIEIYRASGVRDAGVKLLVVGSGPLYGSLRAQIEAAGLCNDIAHLSNVKNSMMPLIYSRAEALILASEYDQWGLCVNEAMSVGAPCIVSERCGVAGELVHHDKTGIVFRDDTDLQTAATALQRIISEPGERSRLSQAAQHEIENWGLPRFSAAVQALISPLSGHSTE